MNHKWPAAAGAVLGCGMVALGFAWQVKPKSSYESDVLPVLKKYCVSCHHAQSAPRGLDFTRFTSAKLALAQPSVWIKTEQMMGEGLMPPSGSPMPAQTAVKRLLAWIKTAVAAPDCNIVEPGRVTLRRLNRVEYDNTIRDLLQVEDDLSQDFPNDDVGYGFDNIGDVLSLSPLLMEKYLDAAEIAVKKAIYVPEDTTERIDLANLKSDRKIFTEGPTLALYSNIEVELTKSITRPGRYRIRLDAYATQAGDDPAQLAVLVDHKKVTTFSVMAPRGKPQPYEVPVELTVGEHVISFAFSNDYYDPASPDPNRRDRNVYIAGLQLSAPPVETTTLPSFHRQWMPNPIPALDKQPAAARKMFAAFLRRAYRQPPEPADVDLLMRCFAIAQKEGQPFEMGIRLGMQAALISPKFLFRLEPESRVLSGFAIASRLSYFLWSSMPDDRLLSLAEGNKLLQPAVLAAEVKRMLVDPKAVALSKNFASQWLQLRKLGGISLDRTQFPEFDDGLRAAMITESQLFFQSVVSEDRNVLDLLSAKYTFVNERLAALYGIPGVTGSQHRRVSLEGTPRAGVLTQASVLTVTSNPNRTSPVKRGKWILEEVLGTPPPPPPPGVSSLAADNERINAKTVKLRLEQHRKKPECAVCHQKMDVLGFAFENYDSTGKWRDQDGGAPIDASGILPDGTKFSGSEQLRTLLIKNPDQFIRTFTEKLMTYALGRGLTETDRCAIDIVVKSAKSGGYKVSKIITAITLSDPFLKKEPMAVKKK